MSEKKEKTEDEIREEVKKELEHEQEIKEKARKELLAEQERLEKKKSRTGGVFRLIYRLIVGALFIFILFETVMGVLDMQRINDDQEPIWYLDSKTETIDGKEETTYNLGLYVIIKTKQNQEIKVILKPFFLK